MKPGEYHIALTLWYPHHIAGFTEKSIRFTYRNTQPVAEGQTRMQVTESVLNNVQEKVRNNTFANRGFPHVPGVTDQTPIVLFMSIEPN